MKKILTFALSFASTFKNSLTNETNILIFTCVIMGNPRKNIKMMRRVVNFWRLGLKYGAQLSTNPVIRDSAQQNWESIPRIRSMKKNSRAHKIEGYNFDTTWKNRNFDELLLSNFWMLLQVSTIQHLRSTYSFVPNFNPILPYNSQWKPFPLINRSTKSIWTW